MLSTSNYECEFETTVSTRSCLLYNFNNAFMISSVGIVAYSCTYCGNESSKLKPDVFIKKGCITSFVDSPSCRIVSRSIFRSRGLYTMFIVFLLAGSPGDGGREPVSSIGLVVNSMLFLLSFVSLREGGD